MRRNVLRNSLPDLTVQLSQHRRSTATKTTRPAAIAGLEWLPLMTTVVLMLVSGGLMGVIFVFPDNPYQLGLIRCLFGFSVATGVSAFITLCQMVIWDNIEYKKKTRSEHEQ